MNVRIDPGFLNFLPVLSSINTLKFYDPAFFNECLEIKTLLHPAVPCKRYFTLPLPGWKPALPTAARSARGTANRTHSPDRSGPFRRTCKHTFSLLFSSLNSLFQTLKRPLSVPAALCFFQIILTPCLLHSWDFHSGTILHFQPSYP